VQTRKAPCAFHSIGARAQEPALPDVREKVEARQMNALTNLRMLRDHLSQFRFNFTSEAELQTGIEQALSLTAHRVKREVKFSDENRLDFLVDEEIAIETKIGGSGASVLRQVARYAQIDSITGILLITNRPTHTLPPSFNNKPLLVHSLLDGAF
jgi:hypothetical protein